MASLTWKIPQIGSQRVGIFLSKCKKGETHELTNGGKVVLTHIVVNDRATPIKSMSLATLTTKLSGSYKFLDKDENVYGITNLQKTDDYKDDGRRNFNKGNVAEIIFAAAITARFKSKTLAVNSTDIKNIIVGLANRNIGEKSWKSPNKNRNIPQDDICLKIQKNSEWL